LEEGPGDRHTKNELLPWRVRDLWNRTGVDGVEFCVAYAHPGERPKFFKAWALSFELSKRLVD
jgi:hypothetical protein